MPATTVGEFFVDEYLRDPSFYGQSLLWNPATEDPYSDPAVRQRIYSQLQGSGQLKPSFDALNAPTSSWTSGGTDYGSALNIPDAPDRDGGIGEWLKILGTFAALPAGAGLVSGALGAGAAGMGGTGGLEALSAFEAPWAGSAGGGSLGGGGMDFLSSLSDPFGSGGSNWWESLSTPDWSSNVIDSVAPAAQGWGSNLTGAASPSWLESIMNTPGASTVLKSLLPSAAGTGLGGSALGGLLGALTAGLGGSKQTGTQTTVQDIPDWQKPFVMSAMSGAANQYANTAPSSLLAPAEAQMGATINGAYLNPQSNPYLRETYDQGAKALTDNYMTATQPRTDAMFGRSGQAFGGNSGYQETVARNQFGLGQNLKNLATDVYGGNYNRERQNQFTATQNAPSFATNRVGAQFAPVNNFSNISNRSMGSQTSSPLYENKAGQALYGGLLGSQIFR